MTFQLQLSNYVNIDLPAKAVSSNCLPRCLLLNGYKILILLPFPSDLPLNYCADARLLESPHPSNEPTKKFVDYREGANARACVRVNIEENVL